MHYRVFYVKKIIGGTWNIIYQRIVFFLLKEIGKWPSTRFTNILQLCVEKIVDDTWNIFIDENKIF